MSSSINIAPQTVAWEPGRGLVAVPALGQSHNRPEGAHDFLTTPHMYVAPTAGTAVVRQRFYPAQLRRLISHDLHGLAASRHHRLLFSGWDRSLPRMYLPVEHLARLMLEAVDAITGQASTPSNGSACLTLRVLWERSVSSTLVIALESNGWHCDAKPHGALNANWLQASGQSHAWQRLVRQCELVGGWLSVNTVPGGGSALAIHLPVDQPKGLLHSWLTQQWNPNSATMRDGARHRVVSLFAVGRSQSETVEQLRAANIRLQSLARPEDFIYRVCHGRWIWLTTAARIPAFVQTSAWQTQELDRWSCGAGQSAMVDLVQRLDQRFAQLIGSRVPPLDLRTHSVARPPMSRVRSHTQERSATRIDEPSRTTPISHVHSRVQPAKSQAKWRYPI